jgi:hypothetical protein
MALNPITPASGPNEPPVSQSGPSTSVAMSVAPLRVPLKSLRVRILYKQSKIKFHSKQVNKMLDLSKNEGL